MIYFKKCGEVLIYTLVKINSSGYSNDHKVHSVTWFRLSNLLHCIFFPGVIDVVDVQESSSLFETVT